MPVQGRRTTLLDAITQAHSTAHMQQNATRIIQLSNSLLAGTYFFHPFMDLYIFHREPVGLLGVFLDLFFFSLQPSIGGIWVYFWDLYLFRVWWCWIWHIPIWVFWVWFWTCTFLRDILVSFKDSVVFLCKPVRVVRFFWTCNFSRDLAPGSCVFFRIKMCFTRHLFIFTVFVPTLLYPSIYPLPVEYLPMYSSIIGYCLECRLNTGPLNLESDALTTAPWSCERM